jgi:hypothetical protein
VRFAFIRRKGGRVSLDSMLVGLMIQKLKPYIPTRKWFKPSEVGEVWVRIFRVHNVRFGQKGAFHGKGVLTEFGQVRVVVADLDIPYPTFRSGFEPTPSGGAKPHVKLEKWRTTGRGVVLLLLTPFRESEDPNADAAVERRLGLVRATMVSVLGRPVAWERLSEFSIELESGTISQISVMKNPGVFEAPEVGNASSIALVQAILEEIPRLDPSVQNRVKLALRWYERALGGHDTLNVATGGVDELINYWVALETLVSEEEKRVAGAIIGILAKIHQLDTQQIGQTFPISGIYQKRRQVMHRGEIVGISSKLAKFMSDVFLDVLVLHVLRLGHNPMTGLPHEPRTSKYLDRSAYRLL